MKNYDLRSLSKFQLSELESHGDGDPIKAVKKLLVMHRPHAKKNITAEKKAQEFIAEYLEPTGNIRNRIRTKEVYDQYMEYLDGDKDRLTPTMFNRLLDYNDYEVRKASGNVSTVFCIKSSWI